MKAKAVNDLNPPSQSEVCTADPLDSKLPFYLQSSGAFIARRNYLVEREGMESFLFIYTLAGCGIVEQLNSCHYLQSNHMVLLDCRKPHTYKTSPDYGNDFWSFVYVHLDGCGAEAYYQIINNQTLSVACPDYNTRQNLFDIISSIFLHLRSKQPGRIDISLHISLILQQLLACMVSTVDISRQKKIISAHEKAMRDTMAYMQSNFKRKISVDQLSARVNLSKYHFIRLFQQYTGYSPYAWLINYRINQGKTLLRSGSDDIKSIAISCGFSDSNHFIRSFRQATGISPSRYRREHWLV